MSKIEDDLASLRFIWVPPGERGDPKSLANWSRFIPLALSDEKIFRPLREEMHRAMKVGPDEISSVGQMKGW